MTRTNVKTTPLLPPAEQNAPPLHSGQWLLLMHELPAEPSSLRVRMWRRLQQLGALPFKQAVYVVPDSPRGREDFAWLKTEIESLGGEVTLFTAATLDSSAHDALVNEFRRTRTGAYKALAEEATAILRKASRRRAQLVLTRKVAQRLRTRLTTVTEVDFFDAPGRDTVVALLSQIEERITPAAKASLREPAQHDAGLYQGRIWVTRPRPGVDRMASAWLIRRFIDRTARFAFATNPDDLADALPFDMSGVEFSHQGLNCTFETLCTLFGLSDPALSKVAALVHDLDLKDNRFGAPDAATIGGLIEGLQLAIADDLRLLEAGMMLFEARYQSLARGAWRSPTSSAAC